jgi:glycosyltransferase involved in cell wall biosynthesis
LNKNNQAAQVRPSAAELRPDAARRIVYVVSSFPFLRNTFVVRELDGIAAAGARVEVIGLWRPETGIRHARTERWLSEVAPRPSLAQCIADLGWWLRRRPLRLLQIGGSILSSNVFRLHRPRDAVAALLLGASHARRLRGQPSTHLHAHFEIPADTVWVMHRLADFSYSFTVHTDEGIPVPSLPRNARDASFIATPSHHTEAGLRRRVGPSVPIVVIRAAIPVDEYTFSPREISSTGPVRAVCVAGLESYKGHAVLLEALAADAGLERITVDLVGDGPLRGELENLARELGLTARVRFHGSKTEDEVRGILAEADLLVQPSVVGTDGQRDNVPVALMEAMASGVPVVASRFAGIPELVVEGVTGSLVRPGDVADLRRTLRRVLDSGAELRQITERARAAVEKEFDLPANAARLAGLLCRTRESGRR